ncbi:MAG: KaiC domain-containing protein, partial [Candidatus Aenigmarchaeota archaeon]|nr:KaiC domain-containing protein [Candidatus Aenigmarchaeota archaeon]
MPKSTNAERVTTGIIGLDKLIGGGLIKGSTTLVSGSAGTGKTIFCAQFIWEGLQKGENCMFITLEEKPEEIKNDVVAFGWDFEPFEKRGKLFLEYRDPFEVTDIVAPLIDKIKANKIQRVAIDSTSTLGLYFNNPFEVRKQLFKLLMALKSTGTTAVLTAEVADGNKLSRFGV